MVLSSDENRKQSRINTTFKEEETVMTTEKQVKQYPQVAEAFELELDGDADGNTPLGMVKAFGYNPEGWKFQGEAVTGKHKGKFKLVQIGYQPNLDAAKAALEAKHGPTPQGQWMKAFKDAYPEADGKGPVGIADASWVGPYGGVLFPYVRSNGGPSFRWTDYLREYWRWLVAVPEGE